MALLRLWPLRLLAMLPPAVPALPTLLAMLLVKLSPLMLPPLLPCRKRRLSRRMCTLRHAVSI